MAPNDGVHIAKGVKAYMALVYEGNSPRQDKQIARSSELKSFLVYLSERAPSVMDKLLKLVSRKCEKALKDEKKSQNSRKRAGPPLRHGSNAKRTKFTGAAKEKSARQPAVDDEEDDFPDDATEKEVSGFKLEEKEASASSNTSSVHEKEGIKPVFHSAYEIESGLATGSDVIEEYVRASLLSLEPSTTRPNLKISDEITKIWKVVHLLDFFKSRRDLHQHLDDREKMPGEKLQARSNWDISEPSEILDTLQNVKRNTVDNKIHRAYGQQILFTSVNTAIARGFKSTCAGHRCDHTAFLEELARKKAGPVSEAEVDQTIASYFYEYYAGQRWSAVTDWFGGSGIVLIFVVAGIGSYYVETRWTEFQRRCVQHFAGLLHSIRRLVEALGPDAAERYCRNGCLGHDSIERVKMAYFTQPDEDEEFDDADEESDDEDEESGDEDEESGDEDEESEDEDEEYRDEDEEYRDEDGESGNEDEEHEHVDEEPEAEE